ncbi:MAG: hypothetical protein ACK519_03175 [Sphingomonadaceae bacterium]|jgi:predicted nucleic acid binding AN1-type Zn finger protein
MLKFAITNILLLVCSPSATASAQTATVIAQATPGVRNSTEQAARNSEPSYEMAYNFAKTLRTEEMLLAESQYYNGDLAKDLLSDPDVAAMEADFPRITQYLLKELRSEIEKQVAESLPALWNSLAKLFVKAMNERQLADALAYHSSSSGKRLIAATLQNTDYSRVTKAALTNPEGNITGDDLANAIRAGAGTSVAAMSHEDQSALLAFMKTEAFGKIRDLGPIIQAISTEWVNQSSPENDQRIEKIIDEVIEEFVEKAEAGKQGK